MALMSRTLVQAADQTLEEYLLSYDYASRKEMEANSQFLVNMLAEGKAQLIDIRF